MDFDDSALNWNKGDLIPVIVQDQHTRQVLMLGYMNQEALARTRETGLVTFFSRSRQTLWTKGETSGNQLLCKSLLADCDGDTILVLANPKGPTCHRGTVACFDEETKRERDFLWTLQTKIDARLREDDDKSYVASLTRGGIARVAQKVGEEGVELAIAAATGKRDETVSEAADLVFHTLLLLRSQNLSLDDVIGELEQRAR